MCCFSLMTAVTLLSVAAAHSGRNMDFGDITLSPQKLGSFGDSVQSLWVECPGAGQGTGTGRLMRELVSSWLIACMLCYLA